MLQSIDIGKDGLVSAYSIKLEKMGPEDGTDVEFAIERNAARTED